MELITLIGSIVLISLVLFLLIRKVVLWYLKIDENLNELKQMNRNLVALLKHYGVKPPQEREMKAKQEVKKEEKRDEFMNLIQTEDYGTNPER